MDRTHPNDLADGEPIRRHARRLLLQADALGRIPTPLGDLTQAASIEDVEDVFEEEELPSGLVAIVRRLKGKVKAALAFRERKIYIARDLPEVSRRFAHGHELGHDVLPWHREAYRGDDGYTLLPETRDRLEREASAFSAEILFQLDRFAEMAADYRTGLGAALELSSVWGNSYHSTIRRYVETNPRPCALIEFGRYLVFPSGLPGLKVLELIDSASFRDKFGPIGELMPTRMPLELFPVARDAHRALRGDLATPVIAGQMDVPDTRRGRVELDYEVFSNTYRVFALLFRRQRLQLGKRVSALWTPEASASA